MAKYIDIVLTDPPGPNSQFVEVEDQDGKGISIGQWVHRPDGLWALRIERDNMLMAGKTESGTSLYPRWWCFLFGGNYRQVGGGYGWRPNLLRLTVRYYKEGWRKQGYSWFRFVGLK